MAVAGKNKVLTRVQSATWTSNGDVHVVHTGKKSGTVVLCERPGGSFKTKSGHLTLGAYRGGEFTPLTSKEVK